MNPWPPINLTGRNETDVREAIIVPLLEALHYKRGTSCDILTEITLIYPRLSLGRAKASDPILKGRADYILEVDERLRWVIEAKGPGEPITDEAKAQAFTYANHHEVRAIYFMVTNGHEIHIHRTTHAPSADAILIIKYTDLQKDFLKIHSILSPDALRRDYPNYTPDTGAPLALGLRSFAKVEKGIWAYDTVVPLEGNEALLGIQAFIREGVVQRDQTGKIWAYLKFSSGRMQIDQSVQNMGLDVYAISTEAQTISTSPDEPTKFTAKLDWPIKSGTEIFDGQNNRFICLPMDMNVSTDCIAEVFVNSNTVCGTLSACIHYATTVPLKSVSLSGRVNLNLA